MSDKKERNYWPHSILAIIIIVVISGAYTVNIAVHHPVQESTYFMDKYQAVEDNAYELQKKKDAFDKNYKIYYSISKFKMGKNPFWLKIVDKATNKPINDAKVDMLLTRPETNKYNLKLKPQKVEDGTYIFANLDIKKLGRWKILTKTKIGKFEGFNSYDLNATRK